MEKCASRFFKHSAWFCILTLRWGPPAGGVRRFRELLQFRSGVPATRIECKTSAMRRLCIRPRASGGECAIPGPFGPHLSLAQVVVQKLCCSMAFGPIVRPGGRFSGAFGAFSNSKGLNPRLNMSLAPDRPGPPGPVINAKKCQKKEPTRYEKMSQGTKCKTSK